MFLCGHCCKTDRMVVKASASPKAPVHAGAQPGVHDLPIHNQVYAKARQRLAFVFSRNLLYQPPLPGTNACLEFAAVPSITPALLTRGFTECGASATLKLAWH